MTEESDDAVENLIVSGNQKEKAGELDEALQLYQRAIEMNPQFTRALYHIFLLLHKQGRTDDALEYADHIVTQEPAWIDFIRKKIPDYEFNPPENEEEILEEGEESTTDNQEFEESVLEYRIEETHSEEVESDSADSVLVDYKAMKAKILHVEGRVDAFRDPLHESSDSKSIAEQTPVELIEVAFANYQDGIEIDNDLIVKVPFWKCLRDFLHSDPYAVSEAVLKEGVKANEKKLKSDKSNIDSWRKLASFHFFLEDMEYVEKTLNAAIHHNPESGKIWFMLGAIHWKLGHKEDSMIAFEKAHSLSPEDKLLGKYYGYIGLKVKFEV